MRWSARRHLGGIFSVNKEQVKMRKCWQLLCRGYNLFLQLRLNNPIRTTDCNPRRKKVARRCTAATQYTFNMATEWRNCHHIASTGTHWRTLWQHTHTHTHTHARTQKWRCRLYTRLPAAAAGGLCHLAYTSMSTEFARCLFQLRRFKK